MNPIERLTYRNARGESVEFSRASRLHTNFKDVRGLADVQNAIYSVNGYGQDGDTFISSRIESRDIEIVGHLRERDKVRARELRRRLCHVLNPHLSATLTYELGRFKRVIGCSVDNAPTFESDEVFDRFAIQLTCLNPFWREAHETRDDVAAWVGGFEFPTPDGLEIVAGEWEVGYRQPSLIVNVVNRGDVPSGMRIAFRALGEMANPSLLNVYTREFIKIHLAMHAGDVVTVSTGYGDKRVQLTRDGITTDAFRYLDVDSSYLQLAVGDNLFRYDADESLENLEVCIYHNNLYLGV